MSNVFPQVFIPGSGFPDPNLPNSGGVPQFGQNANKIHTITVHLDTATQNMDLGMAGNFLWAIGASSLGALINVKFNDQTGEGFDFSRGMQIFGPSYGKAFMSWDAQSGEWVRFAYGVGGMPFGFRIDNPLIAFQEISGDVNITGGTLDTVTTVTTLDNILGASDLNAGGDLSVAAGVTESVLAANATRRGVWVGNPMANGREILVGDSTTAAGIGIEIAPGGREWFETTDAIYVYNPAVGAQTISVLEVDNT